MPLWGNEGTEPNGVGEAAGAPASHVTPSHPLLMGRAVGEPPVGPARGANRTLQRNRGFRYIQEWTFFNTT